VKAIIKAILECLATLVILPLVAWHWLYAALLGRTRACQAVSQRAAHWPGVGGEYLRRALLRFVLAKVGRGVVVSYGSVISKPTAELEDGAYIGAYCVLGDVRIGAETLLADHVCVPSGSGQHGITRLDISIRQQEGEFRTVRIGCDCWIGSGAVVLADVGDHGIVAAGSVVTQPVAPYMIVAGCPAKPIGDRRGRAMESVPPRGDAR
jgi:acetyltransferase-like isoleucine patch superfamily enzyme